MTASPDRRFDERVALVTGAAQGLGFAIAARLASDGAVVEACDVDTPGLELAVKQIGADHPGSVVPSVLDVADSRAVEEWVQEAHRRHGRVDVLVNNAGIIRDGRVESLTDEDWHAVLDVNLRGVFNGCRAAFRIMRDAGYGRIVSLASMSWRGNFGQANYAAAKAGVVGLTRTIALEGAGHGITANAVAPGLIDTPMLQSMQARAREKLIGRVPLGHTGSPGDVAAAVAYLASDEARYVTGVVLDVDGGIGVGSALR